jgi:hypothetical protein
MYITPVMVETPVMIFGCIISQAVQNLSLYLKLFASLALICVLLSVAHALDGD